MSVAVEIQSSTRQDRTFGSREWYDAYRRLRPAVESFYSMIKDPGKEHIARGRVKMMGLAKTSIMLAFYTASVNFRLIDAFDREQQLAAERAANGGHVVSRRTPRRNRAVSIQYRLNQTSGTDPPEKQPASV